jgi:hypothetical protein
MRNHLAPKVAEHRLYDLFSEKTSFETKASTARWYAEMMIDLFFSKESKKIVGKENFIKLSLGEKLKHIKQTSSKELIDSLNFIKQFGDEASHYKPDNILNKKDVDKVIEKALSLFDFALIDLIKDGGIGKTPITARLFSTFLPSIRVRVIRSIIDINSVRGDSDNDMALLDKLLLALTKNGEGKKAIKLLEKLKKKGNIGIEHVDFWKKKIQTIQSKIEEGILPIAENISDCKRNFYDVYEEMTENERNENKDLIEVFNIMLDQIEPSDMGQKKPNLMILME